MLFNRGGVFMKLFVKENKLISVIFGVSVVVILLYVLSIDIPEILPHASDWFDILFQLSIGFVINFMFYVTQVYIPRIKNNKRKRLIIRRLNN